ncbi:hypothetical protein [Micromonospora sp. CPCC 206061]
MGAEFGVTIQLTPDQARDLAEPLRQHRQAASEPQSDHRMVRLVRQ